MAGVGQVFSHKRSVDHSYSAHTSALSRETEA
jgi:hypothetical protein